jgi:DNA-binding MarR family transcriptional regulator
MSSDGYRPAMTGTPEPRWLDPEEQRAWRALAGVVMRLPAALEHQLQRDSGIGQFGYWVLAMLSEAEDRTLAMSELARRANSSQSRLSHAVSRLEQPGWVRRRPDPDNGRVTLAQLTDAGTELVTAAAPGHAAEVLRLVMADLDPDQVHVLTEVCEQVLDRLDADARGQQGRMSGCETPTTTSRSSAAATTG